LQKGNKTGQYTTLLTEMKRYDILALKGARKHEIWFVILLGMTCTRKFAEIQWLYKIPSPKGSKATRLHYRISTKTIWIYTSTSKSSNLLILSDSILMAGVDFESLWSNSKLGSISPHSGWKMSTFYLKTSFDIIYGVEDNDTMYYYNEDNNKNSKTPQTKFYLKGFSLEDKIKFDTWQAWIDSIQPETSK
jgi:hypothetical protein